MVLVGTVRVHCGILQERGQILSRILFPLSPVPSDTAAGVPAAVLTIRRRTSMPRVFASRQVQGRPGDEALQVRWPSLFYRGPFGGTSLKGMDLLHYYTRACPLPNFGVHLEERSPVVADYAHQAKDPARAEQRLGGGFLCLYLRTNSAAWSPTPTCTNP